MVEAEKNIPVTSKEKCLRKEKTYVIIGDDEEYSFTSVEQMLWSLGKKIIDIKIRKIDVRMKYVNYWSERTVVMSYFKTMDDFIDYHKHEIDRLCKSMKQ